MTRYTQGMNNTRIDFFSPNRYVLTCRYCGQISENTGDDDLLTYLQRDHEESCPGPATH